ncbi:MAG: ATP-binding cassette domain-containing protein [Planctomycetota bacterium]|nr:ATP-binding cassette domain-containing protein [Planctomycetota bacterium]
MLRFCFHEFGVSSASGDRLVEPFSTEFATQGNLAIEGVSGAGKTLLARAIVNVLPPTLRLLGQPVQIYAIRQNETLALHAEDVIMIPQSPASALPPAVQCGQLLERVLGWGPVTRNCAAWLPDSAMECLRLVQLDQQVLTTQASELSGGMAQRFALALAIARGSQLIILDEPGAGLDGVAREEIRSLLINLTNKGAKFIVISHDKQILRSLTMSSLVVEAGRVTLAANHRT